MMPDFPFLSLFLVFSRVHHMTFVISRDTKSSDSLSPLPLPPPSLNTLSPTETVTKQRVMSAEPGAGYVMEALGQEPLLRLGMALGEGTGAVSAMPLIDMALGGYFEMPSFDGIGIDAYQPL